MTETQDMFSDTAIQLQPNGRSSGNLTLMRLSRSHMNFILVLIR